MSARREFLKTSGTLVISLVIAPLRGAEAPAAEAAATGPYPDPDFRQLDTWIVIHPDNTATFFVGKTDGGQGTGTAYRQMMSDELDIAYERTSLVMGCTDITPDQGGSGGSDGVERDGWPMRRVAAEARRVLLELAGQHFGVAVDLLTVANATIALKADPARRVTYAELVGGRRFNIMLTGRNVDATTGTAAVKPVNQLRVVGQSVQRYDVPGKVDGSLKWAVDMKVPGMVHARNVRPPFAGATLKRIDESSVKALPGFIRVVSRGNYVAVVCEREEQAIRAARELKVEWQRPQTAPFPASSDLFDYMRRATPTSAGQPQIQGDPDAAFAAAARVIEAQYEVPFQGHTSIGPAHALADPSGGQMTIYSNDMKAYGLRNGVAAFLGLPREKVRVVYMDGPQVYGRTAADDAGFEAAFLASELGRPVRMQWMRDEETAWDTKGPPYVFRLRGALDTQGRLTALEYDACSVDYNHLGYNEPDTVLMAQLMGRRPAQPARGSTESPSVMYAIANRRTSTRVVGLPLVWETPLRTGNLRDPNGPQVTFAFESFIDELAAAAGADPVRYRLDMLTAAVEDGVFRKARSIAVVNAAAQAFGWDARPSPMPRTAARGNVLTGRGIAYTYRSSTIAAVIAEVEVHRDTGRVWVKRLVCAHDCGLVINPEGLRHTVECGMLHALSRALWEEVQFDTEKVTSVDWASYPTMRHSDTPRSIQIVLVNGDPRPDRPDLPPYGAGEGSHKPLIAAVANAIHDATGVRLRRPPFRSERVLAALRAARAVLCLALLVAASTAPTPSLAAQDPDTASRFRTGAISQVADPVLPNARATVPADNPAAAGPAVEIPAPAPAPAPASEPAPARNFQLNASATRELVSEAARHGRISAISTSGAATTVSPENLGKVLQTSATLIEHKARVSKVMTLPSEVPIDLPAASDRAAVQLSFVLSVPTSSAPDSPRKQLDTYIFDSTGLFFDAAANAYQGEFLVVLANSADRSDAAELVTPVSVAIRAPGAQLIKPQPVRFQRLGAYETVALSVASPKEDHFQIRVSADPAELDADPVQLVVSRPKVMLTPGASSVLGWGIGTIPVTVQVSDVRSPESFQVIVQPEAGEISPNPIPLNAAGIGTARLRSASTGAISIRVGNLGVDSNTAQVRYRVPYAFFGFAIAGGLLGAFLLGRGRKRWPKALAIGAGSGVFGAAAYAAGATAWLRALIGTDTLAGMTEIVVFFLGALVALVGVRALLPKS